MTKIKKGGINRRAELTCTIVGMRMAAFVDRQEVL